MWSQVKEKTVCDQGQRSCDLKMTICSATQWFTVKIELCREASVLALLPRLSGGCLLSEACHANAWRFRDLLRLSLQSSSRFLKAEPRIKVRMQCLLNLRCMMLLFGVDGVHVSVLLSQADARNRGIMTRRYVIYDDACYGSRTLL